MKRLYVVLVLALISFLNAVYLTIGAYNYKYGEGSKMFCDLNNTLSCSSLFSFDFSRIFGIPFSAIAIVVYPVIALIATLGILGRCKKTFEILLGIGILGMTFNLYIVYNELLVKVFCLACLICSISIITITILSAISLVQKKIETN